MKIKRIFALIAVIFLIGIYAFTLIAAISGSPDTDYLLRASIFCTAVIPVMLYAWILIYRIFGSRGEQNTSDSHTDSAADANADSHSDNKQIQD